MTRAVKIADASGMSTDAKWRAWGTTVNAGLAECGMVQTADSGQANWTTAARPTTANSSSDHEFWGFDDALQAEAPIYLQFLYGSGANASGQSPALKGMAIGTQTSGAGALSGLKSVYLFNGSGPASITTSASDNAVQQMLFTHAEGFFMAYGAANNAALAGTLPFFIAVDRTRDQVTGEPTAEGMYVWFGLAGSTSAIRGWGQAFNFDTGVAQAFAPASCMPPGDAANYGGYVFPFYCCIPEPFACAGMVGYMDGEIANYSQFTAAPIGGVNRNYIALSDSGNSSLYGNTSFAGVATESSIRTAFLWED